MIRNLNVTTDNNGKITGLRVEFGPHHVLELMSEGDKTTFVVGVAGRAIRADASRIPSELDDFFQEIGSAHPENLVDFNGFVRRFVE